MNNAKSAPLAARRSGPLKGRAQVPGDKSISQRALILGALADGETRISGLLESGDVHSTAGALRGFGAELTPEGPGRWRVRGTGVGNWQSPKAELDFGNSGTGSRLVMGAMATTPITAVFTGDASLRSRPMARVLDPLKEAFGATYEGQGPRALMPVTLHGSGKALDVDYHVKVASAQVKSALLLGSLNATGEHSITQNIQTRDHTEKMLKAFGADVMVKPLPNGGEQIFTRGTLGLKGCDIEVPRDPSSAAFPLVSALIVPGSEIELPAILLNPRRTGLVRTLLEMGANIEIKNKRVSGGEEIGDLVVRHSELKGVDVPAERAPSMIDEYPILSVAASFATGKTTMRGLEELRVKESDRLEAVARGLKANGVQCEIQGDDLIVEGGRVPGGGTVTTHMDHRIAMSFLTMGLASDRRVSVDDVTMIATSFPEYQDLMRGLGAVMETP
jgi:3-phosphoshikimate 1-carboxyvinyltransferase